jgi:hypothetical protein
MTSIYYKILVKSKLNSIKNYGNFEQLKSFHSFVLELKRILR